MKNIEKYENEISQLVNGGDDIECAIATVAGIVKENSCSTHNCKECQKKCLEWMYAEYKEEILSDGEKDIVKAMIYFAHKCGVDVINVCKSQDELKGVCVYCNLKYKEIDNTDFIESPWLPKNMFKGMESGKKYTIEKLGISCQTQKDS